MISHRIKRGSTPSELPGGSGVWNLFFILGKIRELKGKYKDNEVVKKII